MTNTIYLKQEISCNDCGFTTRDVALFNNHSCDVEDFGGRCEDYPCCGHENGDCNGKLYGSDEAIKQAVHDRMQSDDYDPYYDEPYDA